MTTKYNPYLIQEWAGLCKTCGKRIKERLKLCYKCWRISNLKTQHALYSANQIIRNNH